MTARLFSILAGLCASNFDVVAAQDDTMTWDLEDYNGWNLPFAKTVQIVGTKNIDSSSTDSNLHLLAANSYKLEVDTSALFSIIFVDEASFTDYTEDEVVTLNYTFLGSEPMVIRQGVWTNVQMTIQAQADSTDPSNEITVSDIVIFVALGNPVDSGLDGTLSLCYVPSTNASWDAVNIFQHASPQIPWNYITY